MYGLLFNQLQQYVTTRLGRDEWVAISRDAGVAEDFYQIGELYPDEELFRLVSIASERTSTPKDVLLEDYGAFIAAALLRVYTPLIDSSWRTIDVIAHTEQSIHTVVRTRIPGARPPALESRRISADAVEIDYRSERGLCAVAMGIARGLADHFGEAIESLQPECMHRGDARCLLIFRKAEAAPA